MKKIFPIHGILGILLLILSELFLFKKIDPFYRWFYAFAWWSYILTIDAIVYRLKGNSLILSRTKEFFLMVPWSVFIWLIFEAANLSLKNWYYINLPNSIVERWVGYAVAYGTVLPGIFETTELLETIGAFAKWKVKLSTHRAGLPGKVYHYIVPLDPAYKAGLAGHAPVKRTLLSPKGHGILILLGALCIISSLLIPQYFFSLIWIGFIFLLEPLNYRFGGRSLLKDLEEGNPRKIYLLLTAGLICGFLWEFWNFWAPSKWVYTVPFFYKMKGFEMPILGFLGFPPFAIQVYVMYNFISLFRFGRPLTTLLTAILIVTFSVLIFKAIDLDTVDSYEVRLQDAYWIDSQHREELPRVGIATLDELIAKTKDKNERDELALRLLIPREDFIQWIEKAELVQLKGLGIQNLRLLENIGIHSVSALASETPEKVHERIEQVLQGRPPPRTAKIRIWVNEARKMAQS
jgi:hypothetical protein